MESKEKADFEGFIKSLEDMSSRDFRQILPPTDIVEFDLYQASQEMQLILERVVLRKIKGMYKQAKKLGASKSQLARMAELINKKEVKLK